MGSVDLQPTEVQLVDDDGNPLCGVTLKLTFELTGEGRNIVTDQDGIARFSAPEGGQIQVELLIDGDVMTVQEIASN